MDNKSIYALLANLKASEAQRHADAEAIYLETIRNSRFPETAPQVSEARHEA